MRLSPVRFGPMAVAVIVGCISCSTVGAQDVEKGGAGSALRLAASYVWYDGEQERKVWLNPTLLAEFNPTATGESLVKTVSPRAQVSPSILRGVRFWEVDKGTDLGAFTRRGKNVQPTGQFSQVLHDSPSAQGPMRLLPGNIIVYVNPAWDQAAVNRWASARKLDIVKQLDFGPNIFLIRTGPGLEALETANALYRSGEVAAAFPDWWTEMVPK